MSIMKMVRAATALTTLSVGLAAAPAFAQGFRIEAHGGWDRASSEGVGDNGVLYGVGAGYDVALGRGLFAGIEANADFSTMKECTADAIAAGDLLCVRAGRDLSAGVRFGAEVAPGSRIYALAGYTNARFRLDYTPAGGATTRDSANLDGLRLGAGFEQALGQGLYTKLEYRYSNYEAGTDRHQGGGGRGCRFSPAAAGAPRPPPTPQKRRTE
jgi:outer membrane immunogenic protein